MPLDPARVADTKAWLRKARIDLEAAEFELTNPALLADVVFHAQQTAEKTFKAFLAWHDEPFRRTHNLEELGRQCVGLDPTLQSSVDSVTPLTKYAWKFRYPGEPDEPTREEAEAALALAREVYEAILPRLPEEVRP